jgi:hypothetical protein
MNADYCAMGTLHIFTIAPTVLSKLAYEKGLGSLAIRYPSGVNRLAAEGSDW